MAKRQKTEATGLNLPDIALDALLSFLKDTRGAVNWSAKDLLQCLKLDAKPAVHLLAILEMQGYVAKEGNEWLTTGGGRKHFKVEETAAFSGQRYGRNGYAKGAHRSPESRPAQRIQDNEGGSLRGFSDGTNPGAGR